MPFLTLRNSDAIIRYRQFATAVGQSAQADAYRPATAIRKPVFEGICQQFVDDQPTGNGLIDLQQHRL